MKALADVPFMLLYNPTFVNLFIDISRPGIFSLGENERMFKNIKVTNNCVIDNNTDKAKG